MPIDSETEPMLRGALESEPRTFEATCHLAALLIAQDRVEEARATLAALIEPGADDVASERLSQCTYLVFQLAMKGMAAALPLLRAIVEHAPYDIVATYRMGEALEHLGEPEAAEAYFEQAALIVPSDSDPWQRLYQGIALVRAGRLAEAEAVLRALLLTDEHPIEAAYHLCRLLIGVHRLPEATTVLATEVESCIRGRRGGDRVKELAPLALQLAELGVREAVPVLERLAEQPPADAILRDRLATALARQAVEHLGRTDAAESALRELLVSYPSNEEAVYQLSQLCIDSGRPSESLSLLASFVGTQRARGGAPEQTALFSDQLNRLAHAGFEDAVPLLRLLAGLAPGDVSLHYRLADAAAKFGDVSDATRHFTMAADATPAARDVWGWFYKALTLKRLGRGGDAETAIRYALSLDAPPVEVIHLLVQLLIADDRFAEAIDVLEAETATARERIAILLPLALDLAERGVREAVPVVERLADHAPDAAAVRYQLAAALTRQAPSDATRQFEQVAAIEPGPDYGARLYQALALLRLGQVDAAESALQELLVLQPENEEAVHELSQLYLDHGRPSASLAVLVPFVGSVRARGRAPALLAQFSGQLHLLAHAGFTEVVPLLRDLATVVPGDLPVLYRLADALERFGHAPEATRYFTQTADAMPGRKDLWGWFFKAQALQRLGHGSDAEAAIRYALSLDAPPVEVTHLLVQLLIAGGRFAEAIDILEAATATARPRNAILVPLALELAERGVREAVPVLERLADGAPDAAAVRYKLATALARHAPADAMRQFQRVAAIEPGSDPGARLYHALALLRLGQVDAAESALQELLVLQPENEEAVHELAQLYLDHDRQSEALAVLAAFIGRARGRAPVRLAQFSGQLHMLSHAGFAEVVPLLRELSTLAPGDLPVLYRLADALERSGDAPEATRYFAMAADAAPAARDVWGWFFKARALQHLGRDADAETAVRYTLLLDAPPAEVIHLLVQMLIAAGRYAEAIDQLDTATATALPRNGILVPLVLELAERGIREAIPVLERLADRAPDSTALRYKLAAALARHAPSDAVRQFQRVAAIEPGPDSGARLYQARALVRLGQIDAAESALQHLLVLQPGNEEAVHELAQLHLDHDRPAASLAVLAAFIGSLRGGARAPALTAQFSGQLHMLSHAGFAEVVALLRNLATLAPRDLPVLYRLADALEKFGDAPEARRYFTQAAEAMPGAKDIWGWFFKAQALQRLGRGGDAETATRHALSIDASPVELIHLLVQLLIADGRFAEAGAILEVETTVPRIRSGILMPLAAELAMCGIASADVVMQRIVESNASDERALTLFAQFAQAFSLSREAMSYVERARTISDTGARRVDSRLMLPYILANDADIPSWKDGFVAGIDALVGSGIEVKNPLACIATPPYFQFFTFGTNTRELYRKAAHLWQAAHPALRWTAPHCLTWRQRPLNKRLRIGFFTQPTFPLVWGIARALDRNAFEVVHLYETIFPMTPGAPWLGAADRHVAVPSANIADAQRVVAEQELDVLVHMPYTNLRYFLSHARLAPIQSVLCEPCYTDGIENLDYYISWDSAEPVPLDDWYSCSVALMDSAPYWFPQDYTRPVSCTRSEFPLPQDARWYVCPATAPKLHPGFDPILARILAADPDGVLVLLRGETPMGRAAVQRIRRVVGPAADRVRALPTLKADRAHALLGLADSVLDAWPIGGMSSAFAAIHAGVPSVTMPEDIPFGRWLTTMYEAIGVTDLIAKTPDDYVRLSLRLASDPAWRAELADRIRARRDVFVENLAAVREIETFLHAAVSAAHRGDTPRHWKNGRFTER